MRTINLHLVIYEGVRLSGIQRRLVQLILLCWRGEPPGYLRLLSPPLPPHRPRVQCLLPSAAQRHGRERDGRRSERGSQAGLTLWPPTAGAEAATRPASLRKGSEGSMATNTRGKPGIYILCLLNTNTHTSITPLCRASETGTYVGNIDTFEGVCPFLPLPLSFVPLFLAPISPSCPPSSLSQLPVLLSLQDLLQFVLTPAAPTLSSSLFRLNGPIGGVGSVWQAGMLGHEHLGVGVVDIGVLGMQGKTSTGNLACNTGSAQQHSDQGEQATIRPPN